MAGLQFSSNLEIRNSGVTDKARKNSKLYKEVVFSSEFFWLSRENAGFEPCCLGGGTQINGCFLSNACCLYHSPLFSLPSPLVKLFYFCMVAFPISFVPLGIEICNINVSPCFRYAVAASLPLCCKSKLHSAKTPLGVSMSITVNAKPTGN